MHCRPGCGACCIALSISSPLPGLPDGKPAGMRCPHLSRDFLCLLYELEGRPEVCGNLVPLAEMCGSSREDALRYLENLENLTRPE